MGNVRTYKGLPELFLDLENKRIDAIVIDSIPGLGPIKKSEKAIKKINIPRRFSYTYHPPLGIYYQEGAFCMAACNLGVPLPDCNAHFDIARLR